MDELILQFDYEWREGDRNKAKEIARKYISAHREQLEPLLGDKSVDELVKMVEGYREAHRFSDRIITDMWLLSDWEPPHVIGVFSTGAQNAAVAAVESFLRGDR